MKNKRILIACGILSLTLVGTSIPMSIAISNADNQSTTRILSNDITPTKPGRGETVSFLPNSLADFWKMEDLVNTYPSKALEIGELTPYSDELNTWTYHQIGRAHV